jgi:isoaspartyl peptidase/L-asparaginase-like protein (Ntn-hydrolase superfamily)
MAFEPIIVVHGGAAMFASDSSSTIDDYIQEERRNGVKEATKVAWRLLKDNQSAVNAVEAAVTALEDSSYFNAG